MFFCEEVEARLGDERAVDDEVEELSSLFFGRLDGPGSEELTVFPGGEVDAEIEVIFLDDDLTFDGFRVRLSRAKEAADV